MNLPELESTKDRAIDLVVSILNKAHEKLGFRRNLNEIASTRAVLTNEPFLKLDNLKPPLAYSSEKFIKDAIDKTWELSEIFKYHIKYMGGSHDECSHYYYFEVIFSQPTAAYPIPQVTCSVFFIVEDKRIGPLKVKRAPMMTFRVEGHHMNHDVRFVKLIADWILEVLMMKMRFFRRIEQDIAMF